MREPTITDKETVDKKSGTKKHKVLYYFRDGEERIRREFGYSPADIKSYQKARQSAEDLKAQWLKDKENNSDKIGGELNSLSLTDQALLVEALRISKEAGVSLYDAVRDGTKTRIVSQQDVGELWDLFLLDYKNGHDGSERVFMKPRAANSVRGVRCTGRYFKDHFRGRTLGEMTTDSVKPFIFKNKGHDYHRKTKSELSSFFSWCKDNGYSSLNPCTEIKLTDPKGREKKKVTSCLNTEQAAQFMRIVLEDEPRLAAYFALQLFGGLRAGEVNGQRPIKENGEVTTPGMVGINWKNIFLTNKTPVMLIPSGKNLKDRKNNIHPTLLAWLKLGGDLYPDFGRPKLKVGQKRHKKGHRPIDKRAADIRRRANLKGIRGLDAELDWDSNLLRHTYGTMHYAAYGNKADTIMLMGNSEQTFDKHYDSQIFEEEALKFWDLTPESLIR